MFFPINSFFAQSIDPILVPSTRTIDFDQARIEFNEYYNDIVGYLRDNSFIQTSYGISWANDMLMFKPNTSDLTTPLRNRTAWTANIAYSFAIAARYETNTTWKNIYLDVVEKSAEFLLCMQSQTTGGGIPLSPAGTITDDPFPAGHAAAALVECYLTTGNSTYRNAAINLANWAMVNQTYPYTNPDDAFKYYSNVNIHARLLWGLAYVYSITGTQEYLDRCIEVSEEIIAWQNFTDSRDPFDPSLKTGTGTKWDDGGWYWFDYSPSSMPDEYAVPNDSILVYNSFSHMRSVSYNATTLSSLIKVLEVINQHTLAGTTTLRNENSFLAFKNSLIASIKKGFNYLINLQETTDSGNERRGYFSGFTADIYYNTNTHLYEINRLSSPDGLNTIVEGYVALLKSKALTSTDNIRLIELINSVSDHMESHPRTTTGWAEAEWYSNGILMSWSSFLQYKFNSPYNSNLTLVNPGFEDNIINWELWS